MATYIHCSPLIEVLYFYVDTSEDFHNCTCFAQRFTGLSVNELRGMSGYTFLKADDLKENMIVHHFIVQGEVAGTSVKHKFCFKSPHLPTSSQTTNVESEIFKWDDALVVVLREAPTLVDVGALSEILQTDASDESSKIPSPVDCSSNSTVIGNDSLKDWQTLSPGEEFISWEEGTNGMVRVPLRLVGGKYIDMETFTLSILSDDSHSFLHASPGLEV
jgi:hypothetical protein